MSACPVSEQKGLNKHHLLVIAVNVSTTKAHVVFQSLYLKPASTGTDLPTQILMV